MEEKVIERRTEIIRELPPSPGPHSAEVPRSVKEWDVLSKKTSHRSPSPSSTTVTSRRSPSPTRTHRSHRSRKSSSHISRARSVSSATRELIISEDREESATIRGGIGALIVPNRERRTERNIKAEIRALEAERRLLRSERESGHEMIVVKERGDEVVEVRKDKKGRLSLVR